MKKFIYILAIAACLGACSSQKMVIPRAVNTINPASLKELNLERNNYEILNTITAEATITYRQKSSGYKIAGENEEFSIEYQKGKTNMWDCKFSGILRFGYFSNDYHYDSAAMLHPEEVARGLAIYRAINLAQQYGADAVVEPTIATNVEQVGKDIVFKSTVTAKLIKIKTDH